MRDGYVVAVVGATGAVGRQAVGLLEARRFPVRELRLAASPRSAGKRVDGHPVVALSEEVFEGCDIAIFDVPDEVSREWAPRAASRGVVVIDNAATFRLDPDVPLVIPEINGPRVLDRPRGIIANPNCTTATFLMPLAPLHRRYGLRRVVACSYQSVSGAGQAGVEQLWRELRAAAERGEPLEESLGSAFSHPIVFNVIPAIGSVRDGGHTSEELKAQAESRKILEHPTLEVGITCVRVPTLLGHGVAVHATFEQTPDLDEVREILRAAPGVEVVDDPRSGRYPTPLGAAGRDPAYVGRIRFDGAGNLAFFVVADNLRKGAALNAVQIAETVVALQPGLRPQPARA
ncbi:MAG: aspartate-semialdehyde dehydrogenase [Armatimonadota bacterium]|nr:aspartate-semialdehyde dehydrogenase [Armatimonadota bacterium]MDR7387751.1 aspartate-semialdehyde dehydrogenase [Armatimonadota bacterium]MDR7390351.1 aspartate-semialdehyde dehydrogenase [Armatimonadota bacterium]MDR7392883.1 aspartate-semialdehyde dehydrogenase [Armatimonadota bacterium]MDR7395717.1 aspartate-semialdehyde dehydrogenase [Armatimonadota bacterium]